MFVIALSLLALVQETPAGPASVGLPEEPQALALTCAMVTNEHWVWMMTQGVDGEGEITAGAVEAASDAWLARASASSEADAATAAEAAEQLDLTTRIDQTEWCVTHLED